jgi:hypothetical protein
MGNEYGKNIFCYLIGNRLASTPAVQMKAQAYKESKLVFFNSYEELLSQAIRYHQEFIDRYDEMIKTS